jgi:hypothetical protein
MDLPEFTKKLIKEKLSKYCTNRIPKYARDKVRLIFNIKGNRFTLIETRPYFQDPSIWTKSLIAQFRFDNEKKQWLLYSIDQNNKWQLYDLVQPSTDFDVLLKVLDRDPTGIFWG